MLQRIAFLVFFLLSISIMGCSGGGIGRNPIDTDSGFALSGASDIHDAIGIMGAYTLTVDPVNEIVELNPLRKGSIGESYIVSGLGFFTVAPCADCLKLVGFSFSGTSVILTYNIRHPFNKGDPAQPPTAKNRLDLDVFDLALVIVPTSTTPTAYTQLGIGAYAGTIINADGYTRELSNLTRKPEAMPYVLVEDDSEELPIPTGHYNEFSMGANKNFNAEFKLTPGTPVTFDLYLTMGYGFSAKKPQRLDPKYYNPEFNRKAAWKVTAEADGFWISSDSTTPVDVVVKVYDWQIGAHVDPALPLQTDIYAKSEVESVAVEIPGMNDTLQSVAGSSFVSGDGGPDDPLIYKIPIKNENQIGVGTYIGLVRVKDERAVGAAPPTGDRDYLIDSPDGIALDNYAMPEYSTYQAFDLVVIAPPDWHEGGTWDLPAGPCTLDFGIISSSGHAYVVMTDLTAQCTEIWKYPGWGNPPAFYASLVNLDPLIPAFQPYPPTRIDAAFDGALGWCNINSNPWIMAPTMVWNASTYCNFDLNRNFVTVPEADDNRHYMIHIPSNSALFAVDCCDTFDGYQCALYVETGWGLVGFQGIPGAPQGFNYTDADIDFEAFFPPINVGPGPGQVDPADVSGIDCRVGPEQNTLWLFVAQKANRKIEVFTVTDVGPGPNDLVMSMGTIQVFTPGALQVSPIDIELLPGNANFIPAPFVDLLCVLIDNTVAPFPPPGVGGSVLIYSTGAGYPLVDQIGDNIIPACMNIPKFIDNDDDDFSVHIMQQGPAVTRIDYF